jgi:hypothetical protein
VQQTLIECPSGGLDGQDPETAARRELEEETGWVAERLEPLGSFYASDGISDEEFWVFLATGLRETGRIDREPTEQIELEFMPFEEAVELALCALGAARRRAERLVADPRKSGGVVNLDDARRHYADEVALAGGVRSERVIDAFTRVSREDFLGPGPWQIPLAPGFMGEP